MEVVVTQHCERTEHHWRGHFKMVHFMFCECHLDKNRESFIILNNVVSGSEAVWLRGCSDVTAALYESTEERD